MNKSHTLLTLALCCALLVACGGKPEATTAPAATATVRQPPPTDTALPTATSAVAVEDTATPAGGTPAAIAPSPKPTATDTVAPTAEADETPAATATPGQPPAAETAVPVATSEYAGGRLGYTDEYVSAPEVAEQAAALGYDPVRLFVFVRDEVAFESYQGVLRGALGTLWGRAGNAADQAMLLYSLLRESGIEAQFARGTLSQADAQTLLETMFTPPLELNLPDVEPSGEIADPLNDPALLAETTGHLWVQVFTAQGWVDLDPSFPGAEMGNRYAEPVATFARPPDELYHRLGVRVRLERITPDGLKLTYPLEYEGRVATMIGQEVSFGHALEGLAGPQGVEAAALGRIIGAQQRRYLPVLTIGETVVVGQAFTEAEGLDMDSPVGRIGQALGSDGEEAGPVSGEWLEFTLTFPDGSQETFERTVFDRLGPDARAANDLDRLMRIDMTDLLLTTYLSILIAPGRLPLNVAKAQITAILQPLMDEHDNLQQHLDALRTEGIESETRRFALDALLPYDTRLWIKLAHVANLMMASMADESLDEAAAMLAVRRYYDSPRVLRACSSRH